MSKLKLNFVRFSTGDGLGSLHSNFEGEKQNNVQMKTPSKDTSNPVVQPANKDDVDDVEKTDMEPAQVVPAKTVCISTRLPRRNLKRI